MSISPCKRLTYGVGRPKSYDKIASADIQNMEENMTAYYATLGKSFSDFKAVIPLDWMVGGAKVLPTFSSFITFSASPLFNDSPWLGCR